MATVTVAASVVCVNDKDNENDNEQLEIWGRAQREAARGRKTYWGDNLWAEILLLKRHLGMQLHCTASAAFILGW